jgi:DNA-binding FadR family transcriptional regulator
VTRLHQEVLDTLLARIVSGEYQAGALLPKEEAVAEEFDVSRGTAREALRALEERRVAMVKHGRGARVQPPEEWNALDPIVARALATGRARRGFLREVEAYRLVLESEAAALAAEQASADQRGAIRVRAAELVGSDDLPRAVQRLRRQIAVAAGNRPLAATLRALTEAVEPSLGKVDIGAYEKLATAVVDGDASAAREAARRLSPTFADSRPTAS